VRYIRFTVLICDISMVTDRVMFTLVPIRLSHVSVYATNGETYKDIYFIFFNPTSHTYDLGQVKHKQLYIQHNIM
jgi:hypothetical protein